MNLRYRFIITLLLLLGTQLIAGAQLRYGFRFGGDFTKASLGNVSDLNHAVPIASQGSITQKYSSITQEYKGEAALVNRSGFSGGLMLEYQFEKCGFAPDIAVLYTRYNTRIAFPGKKPLSFGRNFIEIPLHLKWKFWIPQTKNLFAPMIYTGPSLLLRLGHNDGIPYTITYADTTGPMYYLPAKPTTFTFASKTVQPGWDVGIGFDIINFIQITAGYRFGLGNALKSPDTVTMHTNAWNVAANIIFDF